MPGLLVIAHAPLASALREVALHAFADAEAALLALDVPRDMPPEQIEAQAAALLAQVRSPEALILADVFGATPCNVAQRLADGREVRLVAGVNVPMLWRALSYRDSPIDQLVERALAGAAQGVLVAASSRPQAQAVKTGTHEKDAHHHQQ
jgi:PTS system ascorbate-specific IIA component